MVDVPPPPRIVRLPAALVNQIAAGEVVERAASVVKELCENSIDAGARRVDVDIAGGGRSLIRIVDDGCGMTPEEARLALERHATSKLRCEDDLWGVQTFGFRGEALPSIASVSRLTLKTCPPDASEGYCLEVHAGQEVQANAVGMPAGTQLEVRDLFFNTPARLKFQKTEATETSNVSEALLRLALANPDVHFRLRVNGRMAMDLPPHRELAERVRAAMARRGAGVLHEAVGDENGICVQAFLAAPECASTTSRNTFTFVGRRFVRDRSLLQALCMGYGDSIDKGRYPLAIVFVDVPGEDVDVNVHPQKLEVRFAQPQPVYAAVRHVLTAALATAPWVTQDQRPYSLAPAAFGRAGNTAAAKAIRPAAGEAPLADLDRAFTPRMREDAPLARDVPGGFVERGPAGAPTQREVLSQLPQLGVLSERFILLQDPVGGLVVVDHTAAAEQVLTRAMNEGMQSGRLKEQRLLFPIAVEVEEAAMRTFAKSSALLDVLGFDIGSFGTQALLVRAVPELAGPTDPKPLLLAVLGACAIGAEQSDITPQAVAAVARHVSLQRRNFDPSAIRALLAQLDNIDLRAAQRSGRAVVVRLPLGEIERRFGRS